MANWTHTYREESIPGPVASGVITSHMPGKKLASAITELQEKVISEIGDVSLEGIRGRFRIENNALSIYLEVIPPEIPDPIPSGGENGDVLTKQDTAYLWQKKFPSGGKEYQVLVAIPNGSDGITGKWDYVRAVELQP